MTKLLACHRRQQVGQSSQRTVDRRGMYTIYSWSYSLERTGAWTLFTATRHDCVDSRHRGRKLLCDPNCSSKRCNCNCDYRKNPNWAEDVLQSTNGQGVDSTEETLKATRQAGLIRLLGVHGNTDQPVPIMNSLLFGAKTIQPVLGAGSRELSEELSAFLEEHKIHPLIAETFEFEHADKALEALKTLSTPGKTVIKIA